MFGFMATTNVHKTETYDIVELVTNEMKWQHS